MNKIIYGKNLGGNGVVVLKNVGKIKLGNKVFLNSHSDRDFYRTGLLTHHKDPKVLVDIFNLNGVKLLCEKFNLVQGFNEIEIPTDRFSTTMLVVKVNITEKL